MPTLAQILPYILAALIAMAALIPGLDAVEKSIIDLKESRKSNAKELCYAKVEYRQKFDPSSREAQQRVCENAERKIIDESYATVLNYIGCFRELVTLTSGSAATSDAVAASAASCTK